MTRQSGINTGPVKSGIEYERAVLTPDRFGIDGAPFFWGYHDELSRWNGWARPCFSREVAERIADWVNHGQPGTAWWEGSSLCLRPADADEVQRVEPDELGLYSFDGWAWSEMTDDD